MQTMLISLTAVMSSTIPAQSIPLNVEHGIQISDSAFFATLEWYDIKTPHENIIEAFGRVHPIRLVWGQVPSAPVEIGFQHFLRHGGSRVPTIWDNVSPGHAGNSVPVIVFSSGSGNELKFVYVIGDGSIPLPSIEDVLAVRGFENQGDDPSLREDLIQRVLEPVSAELVWQYALRRLFILEDDPGARFNLVLDPRLQTQASADRLNYAVALLSGSATADIAKSHRIPMPQGGVAIVAVPRDEVRTVINKLIGLFETTSSPNMAEASLATFIGDAADKAQFTENEWDTIRRRVRIAIENPDHPLNKLPTERRSHATKVLERLMREPTPFAD